MPWRWPWYRKLNARDAGAITHPLREFVYLDEGSVYSLLASRSGPVPTEFTDTETASLKDEVTGGASVGVPGTKVNMGTRMESATSSSSQIVRKASAQARFKQFLEAEEKGFVFSVQSPDRVSELSRPPARGDLFEMDVELDVNETFRAVQAITSMLEIVREDGVGLFADLDATDIKQVFAVSRVLDRLLVGLVPIQARAVEYRVVRRSDGEPTIVRRTDPGAFDDDSKPLFVVGFAEKELFWKDLRAVLFGAHRFTLTGRLTSGVVQSKWSPVKLTEVLRPYMPEVAEEFDQAGHYFATGLRSAASSSSESSDGRLRDALLDYVARVGADGDSLSQVEDSIVGQLPVLEATLDGTLEKTREVFDVITEMIGAADGVDLDDADLAAQRSAVIAQYGLPPGLPITETGNGLSSDPPPTDERYLEAEIIALYW